VRRPLLALFAAGALAAGAAFGPTASAAAPYDPLAYGFQGEGGLLEQDLDARAGRVAPTAAQRAAVAALGARAEWNPLGSPQVLTRDDAGYLSGPQTGRPAEVARAWVRQNAAIFGLTAQFTDAARLEMLKTVPLAEGPALRAKLNGGAYVTGNQPHVVLFRQVFDGAPTGQDGLITVLLDPQNRITFVSSSATGDTRVTNRAELSVVDAYLAAAEDVDVEVDRGELEAAGTAANGAALLTLDHVKDQQRVRLVTVPTPQDGVRLAYEVIVIQSVPSDGEEHAHGGHPYAWTSLVDAQTGNVLVRVNNLDHFADTAEPSGDSLPYWQVFPNAPLFPQKGVRTPDTRTSWCYMPGTDCERVLGEKGGEPNVANFNNHAYDEQLTDGGQRVPSFSTSGNNARTAPSRVSFLTPDVAVAPVDPTRTYNFPFSDAWHTTGCNPATLVNPAANLNDIDAATTNLFVMHNRMHDWSYYLGFTEENYNAQVDNVGSELDNERSENDPELGSSQAGSIAGGPTFLGRDNANQITLADGLAPITNQYLWEPLQAGFYAPCTDGGYDMGIVGHEYGHMISNRMTAGPVSGLSGAQAGSMGESWSDLMAVEYLIGYGLAPYNGENRFSLAPYVTGDLQAGIRNYGPNNSPLNYSNLGYDGNGTTSPHADGEIWNATQIDIRQALVKKYEAQFPEGDKALQAACADGLKASTVCPGNRRWIQLLFDGFLIQPSQTSMLDSRDAILASDKARYGGDNLPTLWESFAKRGMGVNADSASVADLDADPGWENPIGPNGTVTFRPTFGGGAAPEETKVFIGDYEARIVPAAVSTGGAPTEAKKYAPGTYRLLVQAPGYGHKRMTVTIKPGAQTIPLPLRANLASKAAGAESSGDGGNLGALIDETEASNWGSVEGAPRNPSEAPTVQGKQVTVDLVGEAHLVREVQVSAANRPACAGQATANGCEENQDEAPYDTGGQSRFAPVYSFEILTCDATTGKECAEEGDFASVLVANAAFAAGPPRPTAPDLNIRAFKVRESKATHVRIKVLDNQCTGNALFNAENNPEGNPINDPDCVNGFTTAAAAGAPATVVSLSQKKNVRIAELQVFGSTAPTARPVTPAPDRQPDAAAPQVNSGSRLPATGPLPLALPALLLTGVAVALVRGRRRA
jgi:extracellular elastinolytic metalloproteinase